MKITTKKYDNKYEYGAYFKYNDLYKALLNLIPILSSNRFGKDGIYFQRNEKSNESINLSSKEKSPLKINSPITNLSRNNYPILLSKDKFRKYKILLPSLNFNNKLEKNYSNFHKTNYRNFIYNIRKKNEIDKYNISSFNNEVDDKKMRKNNHIIRNKSSYSFMKYQEKYYDRFFYDEKKYLERLNNSKNKRNENASMKNFSPLSNDYIKKVKIKIPSKYRIKFNNKKINLKSFLNKSPEQKCKLINKSLFALYK